MVMERALCVDKSNQNNDEQREFGAQAPRKLASVWLRTPESPPSVHTHTLLSDLLLTTLCPSTHLTNTCTQHPVTGKLLHSHEQNTQHLRNTPTHGDNSVLKKHEAKDVTLIRSTEAPVKGVYIFIYLRAY